MPSSDDTWHFGPDTVPSPEDVFEILIRFFDFYLLSVTSFLLYSVLILTVFYYLHWPTRYGRQSTLDHLSRATQSLLIITAIFPILYVAMWVGTGSVTAGPTLPSGGIFGTPIEKRIIGPEPRTPSFEPVFNILSTAFQSYLTGVTTLSVVVLVFLALLHQAGKLPATPRLQDLNERIYRAAVATFGILGIFPILYVSLWIGTRSEQSHHQLAADGVFGTTFEERFVGASVRGSLEGFISIFGNIIHTYQVTISFTLVSLTTFFGVLIVATRWPLNSDLGDQRERFYRALLGLIGSLSFIPILSAISWLAVGATRVQESFTRVSPPVDLPVEEVFGGPEFHSTLQNIAATKDPVEGILINAVRIQTTTYFILGVLCLAFGILVIVYLGNSEWIPTERGHQSIESGVLILLVVFLLPGLVTAGAWLASGSGQAGSSYAQNMAGTPFYHQDDFALCEPEGWENPVGTSGMSEYPDREGCAIKVNGVIEKTFDLTDANYDQGFVEVQTNDNMTVRIYDGDDLVVDQRIINDRRFDIPVTGKTHVEIEATRSEVDKVTAGLRPLPDPYFVVELRPKQDEFILRNGVRANITVYNIGTTGTEATLPINLIANGTTYSGDIETATQTWSVDGLDGGQWRRFPVTFKSLIQNRTVGKVKLVASTNLGDSVVRERGADFENFDQQTITITYADLHGHLPDNRTIHSNSTTINTRTTNEGTAYANPTTAVFAIRDDDVIRQQTLDIETLFPQESDSHSLSHTFITPGTYNVSYNVTDTLFPEGTTDDMRIDVVYGNLRGSLENVSDTSRIGTNETFSVNITNTGTAVTNSTTATVTVTSSDGEVADQWTLDVPNLSVNETHIYNLSTRLDSTEEYTVELDIDYPEFPIDTYKTEQITGVGPDPNVYLTTPNIKKGTDTDITTTIKNQGTDYSKPTTATAVLTNPSGETLATKNIDIPGLDPGESYQQQLFPRTLTTTGKYSVNVNLDTQFESDQSNVTDDFYVTFASLSIDVTADNTSSLNRTRAYIDIMNEGTGRSERDSANISLVNSDGDTVFTREIAVPELDSGQSYTPTEWVEVPQSGTYTLRATLNAREATTSVRFRWPALNTSITTLDPKPDQLSTSLNVSLTNHGTAWKDSPQTTVTLYESSSRLKSRTITFSALYPGETASKTIQFDLPGVDSYYAVSNAQDPEFPAHNTDTTTNITVQQPALDANISAPDIQRNESVSVDTIIENEGFVESNATTARVSIIDEQGDTVESTTIDVDSLEPGSQQSNTPLTPTLSDVGAYTARINVDTDYERAASVAETTFKVKGSDLRADISADTVREGDTLNIKTGITNDGVLPSESTTATVYIENDIGEVVNQTTISVGSLNSGEVQTNTPLEIPANNRGDYVARINVDAPDDEAGSEETDPFEVLYVDLQGDIEASSTTTTDESQFKLSILNAGTMQSDPVDATVTVWNESGAIVHSRNLSYSSISGDNYITPELTFTAPRAGTYTAQINVTAERHPRLSKHNTTFSMTWPDLHTSISGPENPVTANSTSLDVTIENRGPKRSNPTSATLYLYDSFGNILHTQQLTVPEIASDEEHIIDPQVHFNRPGTYSVGIEIADPEFPAGNSDQTTQFDVVHGNLHSSIIFQDDSSVVETNTTMSIRIDNAGNDRSEATNATLEIITEDGTVVETRTFDVRSLGTQGQIFKQIDVTLNNSGTHTATLTAHDAEFPEGSTDTDTIQAVSPNLKADISVEDTELNSKTKVTVTVTNDGGIQSEATQGSVTMFNQDGDQATFRRIDVPALDPGESTTIEYTQLIHEKCWKTEMSCAPGATIAAGQYEAKVNVNVQYEPEGSIDRIEFRVYEESG
jgi:hypothetical protein